MISPPRCASIFLNNAEEVRFELTVPFGTAHFKCAGINHYPTPPSLIVCPKLSFTFEPAFFQVMLLVVAIRADEFKIREIVMLPVSIPVMHVQYLKFVISAALASCASFFDEPKFQCSLSLNLILRTSNFIFDSCPIHVCTTSTTGLLVGAG